MTAATRDELKAFSTQKCLYEGAARFKNNLEHIAMLFFVLLTDLDQILENHRNPLKCLKSAIVGLLPLLIGQLDGEGAGPLPAACRHHQHGPTPEELRGLEQSRALGRL